MDGYASGKFVAIEAAVRVCRCACLHVWRFAGQNAPVLFAFSFLSFELLRIGVKVDFDQKIHVSFVVLFHHYFLYRVAYSWSTLGGFRYISSCQMYTHLLCTLFVFVC